MEISLLRAAKEISHLNGSSDLMLNMVMPDHQSLEPMPFGAGSSAVAVDTVGGVAQLGSLGGSTLLSPSDTKTTIGRGGRLARQFGGLNAWLLIFHPAFVA